MSEPWKPRLLDVLSEEPSTTMRNQNTRNKAHGVPWWGSVTGHTASPAKQKAQTMRARQWGVGCATIATSRQESQRGWAGVL